MYHVFPQLHNPYFVWTNTFKPESKSVELIGFPSGNNRLVCFIHMHAILTVQHSIINSKAYYSKLNLITIGLTRRCICYADHVARPLVYVQFMMYAIRSMRILAIASLRKCTSKPLIVYITKYSMSPEFILHGPFSHITMQHIIISLAIALNVIHIVKKQNPHL